MGSNGAGEAILNAERLAHELGPQENVIEAFRADEKRTFPLTADVARRNRPGDPKMVIDRVKELTPDGFDDVESIQPNSER